jgi:hypothetical protein
MPETPPRTRQGSTDRSSVALSVIPVTSRPNQRQHRPSIVYRDTSDDLLSRSSIVSEDKNIKDRSSLFSHCTRFGGGSVDRAQSTSTSSLRKRPLQSNSPEHNGKRLNVGANSKRRSDSEVTDMYINKDTYAHLPGENEVGKQALSRPPSVRLASGASPIHRISSQDPAQESSSSLDRRSAVHSHQTPATRHDYANDNNELESPKAQLARKIFAAKRKLAERMATVAQAEVCDAAGFVPIIITSQAISRYTS